MKEITKEMIDIWEMSNMDWMGYTLEKKEHFSDITEEVNNAR